ncbi:MAG: hypothetical protein QG657_1906 [Acidobacteriota bacterium]|nr:hypothetical protein [Acidobacteriota bacterium]
MRHEVCIISKIRDFVKKEEPLHFHFLVVKEQKSTLHFHFLGS